MMDIQAHVDMQNRMYWAIYGDEILEDQLKCFGPDCEKCSQQKVCMMWARV